MWGIINNKKITEIKESYCLGEACLIFNYDSDTRRTVAFKTAVDLRKALSFFKSLNHNFISEVKDNELHIKMTENVLVLSLVNQEHANRLKEVVDNLKK